MTGTSTMASAQKSSAMSAKRMFGQLAQSVDGGEGKGDGERKVVHQPNITARKNMAAQIAAKTR